MDCHYGNPLMNHHSTSSDRLATVIAAMVEAGFDAESIISMRHDGDVVTVDVDCDPEECVIEGGFDERMDSAVETITACLKKMGFQEANVIRADGGIGFVFDFSKKGNCKMTNACKLRNYLAATDTQDALDLIVKVQVPKVDPFFEIMVQLEVVGMLAKDVHYRANGDAFYGNHLLADLANEIEEKYDDLSEIYYMGENQSLPPLRGKLCAEASKRIERSYADLSELALTASLHTALLSLVGKVEIAKTEKNPSSGVAAVLDDIAKEALKCAGLLKRRLEPGDTEE